MTSTSVLDPGQLTELARARACAEAAQTAAMLAFENAARADAASQETVLARQLEVAAARTEMAAALCVSDGQLRARLAEARQVRDSLPRVWLAHRDGSLDAYRVHLIADTALVTKEATRVLLDQKAPAYASTHTTIQLKAWLRRFLLRHEPDAHAERFERAREDRHVDVRHGEDGMAELYGLLPSLQADAIDSRLTREAKKLPADGRSLAQKRADLLAAWATTSDATEASPHIDLAVVISLESLTGRSEQPAEAADGSFGIPARVIRDLMAAGAGDNVFWHRILTDPAGGVLDHTYLGRFAPDLLARAVAFRDGVCQAPGCTTPAAACDLDHRTPWPDGPTSGDNIWALCRPQHALKSHGYLTPVVRVVKPPPDTATPAATEALAATTPVEHGWLLPSGRIIPAEPADLPHRRPPTDASWTEHHLALTLTRHTA